MRCFAFKIFLTAVMVSVVWRVASLTFILSNIQTQTKKIIHWPFVVGFRALSSVISLELWTECPEEHLA